MTIWGRFQNWIIGPFTRPAVADLSPTFRADFRCPECGARLYNLDTNLLHPGGPDDAPSACRNAGMVYNYPTIGLTKVVTTGLRVL